MRRRLILVWLLGVFSLSGCGGSGGSTATASATPTSGGKPWVITTQGSATPSAKGGGGWTASRTPFPSGFLPLPSYTPTSAPTPSWQCTPNNGRGTISGATVVPGTTTAAVTFFNPGGDNLLQFRVTAINEDLVPGTQRDVGWTVVTPATPCEYQTVTVTGLTSKSHYVFSVDAVWSQVGGNDGTNASTIARSAVTQTK